jgi:hypothetical protein
MITLQEFMEAVDYRITEGSTYHCQAYGDNAFALDSWNNVHGEGGHSVSIVFDTKTHVVYESTVCDYTLDNAYRLINPSVKDAFCEYSETRGYDYMNQAWDDVSWIDLETVEDFLTKVDAITSGEDYDTRVLVPLNLPKEDMFKMMQMAHERDLTLNQFVEVILRNMIDCNDPNFGDDWR